MTSDFTTLGIRRELVEQLLRHGVTEPTPIQAQSIPVLLEGQDVIAQAQTGTGKTLAFVLPILERIDVSRSAVQALIITPTRELALQITDEVKKLAPAVGAKVLAAYGGQDVEAQIHRLKGAIHLVIGTPGRLLDHLRRETVDFSELSMLVLDEADQMLHMGFLHEVERIIDQTSGQRQTMLFSATMPPEIRSIAARYMQQPAEIRVESKRITLDEIEQLVIETSDRFKQDALCKLIDKFNPYLAIVFCRTKRRASSLNEDLLARGYDSDELHGDLTQAKREKVMKRFREAKIQLLIATDVAARGLDVEGVTHVFNYDIPQDVESYIHRIGRTGRAGERGVAVTFVAPKDREFLQLIEQGIKRTLPKQTANGQKVPERDTESRHRQEKGAGQGRGRNGNKQGDERSRGRSGGRQEWGQDHRGQAPARGKGATQAAKQKPAKARHEDVVSAGGHVSPYGKNAESFGRGRPTAGGKHFGDGKASKGGRHFEEENASSNGRHFGEGRSSTGGRHFEDNRPSNGGHGNMGGRTKTGGRPTTGGRSPSSGRPSPGGNRSPKANQPRGRRGR